MRINEMINNINNGAGTGINTDLSSVNSAGSFKDKTTALFDDKMSVVGFFKASETKNVKGGFNYTLDEAKGIMDKENSFGDKLADSINGNNENEKEFIKNLTQDDYDRLQEELLDPEKFGKERLRKAIERIKAERELNLHEKDDFSQKPSLTEILNKADIPATEEIKTEIEKAVDIAMKLGRLTDSAKDYLLKNGLSPTIENIYKATHAGDMRTVKIDDSSWESLKEKALEIVGESGAKTEKGLDAARWLVEHNLPVTAENIIYKSELDDFDEVKMSKEMVYAAAAQSMKNGQTAMDGMLITRLDEAQEEISKEMSDLIDRMNGVSDNAIKQAIIQEVDEDNLTIPEIVHSAEIVDESESDEIQSPPQMTEKQTVAYIRMEEVRISLNIEASRRLSANGIDILSDSLARVSEGLKELEKEYLKDVFDEVSADFEDSESRKVSQSISVTTEQAADLGIEISRSLESINNAPLELYKATFDIRHTITLAELGANGELLIKETVENASGAIAVSSSSMQMALASYESSSTEVRRDLGDNIKKAFAGSVDSLLTSNGLEITEGNRRAVRILGYNSMEITSENIENIKYYDEKVTGLVQRMTPPVVMTMIRGGINPLEMTIDELDKRVNSIIREQGRTLEQKYSEFLVRMEETNSITQNERNAYVGIYRLLYNVEKNDGAAIGSLIHSGRELSFENLMTEVRTSTTSVDSIADDYTEIKNSSYVNSVTDQINKAFEYQRQLLRESLDVTDPIIWDRALSGKRILGVTIENLHDGLYPASGILGVNDNQTTALTQTPVAETVEGLITKNSIQHANEIVNTMLTNTPTSSMLKTFGIRDSFANRKTLEDIVLNPDKEDSAISVSSAELSNSLSSASRFDELLGIKTRMANSLVGQAFKTAITAQSAAELNGRVERIEMLQKLASRGHYRLNVDDGDDAKQVNLTLIRNSEDRGTVSVQISAKGYELQADLNMVIMDSEYEKSSITRANLFYTGKEQREINEITENLKKELKNNSINADNIYIMAGTRTPDAYISFVAQQGSKMEEGSNANRGKERKIPESLYRVAKSILASL